VTHFDPTNVTLVCPDNDAESRIILLIAYRLGLCVIRSGQGLGATLHDERGNIVQLIIATGKSDVWVVEMPSVHYEARLEGAGVTLTIIDHHTYGELDRSHDEEGHPLPSSLEQFIALTGVTDEQLQSWGLDPIVVRGIGIMDARFVQGLREEGFSHNEICRVLDFRCMCAEEGNPHFVEASREASYAWSRRETVSGFLVVCSTSQVGIRGAVSTFSIYGELDTHPIIIVDKNGREIFVQNIDSTVVEVLRTAFPEGFTFGTGRCWGVNNAKSRTSYTLDQLLGVLS
jgi:hypothetical protein